ncbi:MAG TPA: nitrous oxide reductase accessory protein NosL [Niabella sp.]|nr:nitrous oxide reductase accessory protein NosL [Chitinophagaceae bacterium]HRO83358.1 nitrous oxide reductase accessory protein NosL [Niabella sp.]HUN01965.1 nitrous oxide reductase accessory protein NosL [Niabella sp.]
MKKINNAILFALGIVLAILLPSCSNSDPVPIKLNVDNCANCNMTVSDLRFGTELITDKGRSFVFDDLKCMVHYMKENNVQKATYYVPDHNKPENFLKAENAFFVKGDSIRTPMNGHIATFAKKEEATEYASQNSAEIINWEEVIK